MLKKDLIRATAEISGKPQEVVREVLAAMNQATRRAVAAGDSVMLVGLGKLVVSERKARVARDLRTGKPVPVPAHKAVVLRPSDGLLSAANGQVVLGE